MNIFPSFLAINGSYKLAKVTGQSENSPNLLNHEFELMIVTHQANPGQIHFTLRG